MPAQLALLCALWALRTARFELANTVLVVTATVSISVLVWQNSGLIIEIGAWVLAEACQQMQHWRSMALVDLMIPVNVSSLQFQRDVIETDIVNALAATGLCASALELELTEPLDRGFEHDHFAAAAPSGTRRKFFDR